MTEMTPLERAYRECCEAEALPGDQWRLFEVGANRRAGGGRAMARDYLAACASPGWRCPPQVRAFGEAWRRDMQRLERLYPASDPASARRFMTDCLLRYRQS